MYKIDQTSWHFQLWRYLLDKSLIPMWFVSERWNYDSDWRRRPDHAAGIPNDLCSYINRILLYLVIQAPALAIIGTVILFVTVLTPVMGWIYVLGGVEEGPDPWFVPVGMVLTMAYIASALWIGFLYLKKETGFFEAVADKLEVSYDTRRSIRLRVNKITSPFQILWDYAKAVHNKVCLRLTFEEDLDDDILAIEQAQHDMEYGDK